MASAYKQTLTPDDLIIEINKKIKDDIRLKFQELCAKIKSQRNEIDILRVILQLIENPKNSSTQREYNKQIEKTKTDPSPLRMLVANLLMVIGILIVTTAGIVATAGVAAPIAIAAAGTVGLASLGGGFFASLEQDTPVSKELAEMKQAIDSPKKGT